jgi:hypothetical protein
MGSFRRLVPGLLICCVICAALEITVDVNAISMPGISDTKGVYSHDAKGLEKEWDPLLKAVSKRDAASIDERYKVFVIPDHGTWFGIYFKREDVEQLGWDYEAEAENGKHSIITMTNLVGGSGFRAHCEPSTSDSQNRLAPRSDASLPLQPVPVEPFNIAITSDNGKRFSFLANYVYVDGAFRFVGKGAYPFWSMPDATRPKH